MGGSVHGHGACQGLDEARLRRLRLEERQGRLRFGQLRQHPHTLDERGRPHLGAPHRGADFRSARRRPLPHLLARRCLRYLHQRREGCHRHHGLCGRRRSPSRRQEGRPAPGREERLCRTLLQQDRRSAGRLRHLPQHCQGQRKHRDGRAEERRRAGLQHLLYLRLRPRGAGRCLHCPPHHRRLRPAVRSHQLHLVPGALHRRQAARRAALSLHHTADGCQQDSAAHRLEPRV